MTEEYDRLVSAPFGTPGLAELGLTDPGGADLSALSGDARKRVLELWGEFRMMRAARQAQRFARDFRALDPDGRQRLLSLLATYLED